MDEILQPCKDCGFQIPKWVANIYKNRCMHCHVGSVCVYCRKPKVPIGTSRVGGKQNHIDWDNRLYHKKCWKFLKRTEQLPKHS